MSCQPILPKREKNNFSSNFFLSSARVSKTNKKNAKGGDPMRNEFLRRRKILIGWNCAVFPAAAAGCHRKLYFYQFLCWFKVCDCSRFHSEKKLFFGGIGENLFWVVEMIFLQNLFEMIFCEFQGTIHECLGQLEPPLIRISVPNFHRIVSNSIFSSISEREKNSVCQN